MLQVSQSLKFALKLLDTIGDLLIGGQQVGDAIGGDAYRLLLVAFEGPSGYHVILFFADEQSYGIAILWVLELVVDARAVEVEFADELWLKLDHLELYNHIATKLEVVE